MTKKQKIVLGVSAAAVAIIALLAFTKKGKKVAKKIGAVIIPESIITADVTGSTIIKQGSKSQYVEQLKDVLNEIHKAIAYINGTCKTISWSYFSQWPTKTNGTILDSDNVFDDKTAKVSQFYLNRQEVELDYLKEIRAKIAKWKQGDKCINPLSV